MDLLAGSASWRQFKAASIDKSTIAENFAGNP